MRHIAIAALLGLLAVATFGSFQDRLDAGGLLADDDVLFDADPGRAMRIMVHGQGWDGQSLQHPLWGSVTHRPLRGVEVITRPFRGELDRDAFMRAAALWLGVLSGAAAIVLTFATLLRLGASLRDAALAALVHMGAFSQVLFASIPEHWVIGGLMLSAAFLLTAHQAVTDQPPRAGFSALLSGLAGAVTVSNLVLVQVPLVAAALVAGVPARRALRTARLACAAAVITVSFGFAVQTAANPGPLLQDLGRSPAWVMAHVEYHPVSRLITFPFEIGNAVSPARLVITPAAGTETGPSPNRVATMPEPGWASVTPLSVVLLALLAAGGICCARLGPPWRAIGSAAAAVIGFNWILHSLWGGSQLFVYSQHWLVTVPLLLGALAQWLNARWRFGGTVLLAVLAAGAGLNSLRLSIQLIEGMR